MLSLHLVLPGGENHYDCSEFLLEEGLKAFPFPLDLSCSTNNAGNVSCMHLAF